MSSGRAENKQFDENQKKDDESLLGGVTEEVSELVKAADKEAALEGVRRLRNSLQSLTLSDQENVYDDKKVLLEDWIIKRLSQSASDGELLISYVELIPPKFVPGFLEKLNQEIPGALNWTSAKRHGGLNTLLFWAIQRDKKEVFRALIEEKCDVTIQDREKCTPLHYAAYFGRLDYVKDLIQAGCNPDARTQRNTVALDHALPQNKKDFANLIVESLMEEEHKLTPVEIIHKLGIIFWSLDGSDKLNLYQDKKVLLEDWIIRQLMQPLPDDYLLLHYEPVLDLWLDYIEWIPAKFAEDFINNLHRKIPEAIYRQRPENISSLLGDGFAGGAERKRDIRDFLGRLSDNKINDIYDTEDLEGLVSANPHVMTIDQLLALSIWQLVTLQNKTISNSIFSDAPKITFAQFKALERWQCNALKRPAICNLIFGNPPEISFDQFKKLSYDQLWEKACFSIIKNKADNNYQKISAFFLLCKSRLWNSNQADVDIFNTIKPLLKEVEPSDLRDRLSKAVSTLGAYNAMSEKDLTLGIEIEYSGIPYQERSLLEATMDEIQTGWDHPGDGSVTFSDSDWYGGESTSPIISNNQLLRDAMLNVAYLRAMGAETDSSCGLHIHVGVENITTPEFDAINQKHQLSNKTYTDYQFEFVKQFLLIYQREKESFNSVERKYNEYANPVSLDNSSIIKTASFQDLIEKVNSNSRYQEINLLAFEKHGTIEIRRFAGTTKEGDIYATTAMVAAMAKEARAKTDSIFEERLIQHKNQNGSMEDESTKAEEKKTIYNGNSLFFKRRTETSNELFQLRKGKKSDDLVQLNKKNLNDDLSQFRKTKK